MTVISDQRGEMSLTGLLVAMILFTVVLGATLGAFEAFTARNNEEAQRADVEDRAHVAVDRLTRELRNVGQPQPDGVPTFERADPDDLVFKTVDRTASPTSANPAGLVRVRYCLNSSTPGNAKLHHQTQAWTSGSTAPADTACPSSTGGWSASTVVTDWISNRAGGQNRPVFGYNGDAAADVRTVHVDLLLDADASRGPKETELSSGIFLRNQNRPPTAVFTPTPSGTSIVLDGSQSADPEGDPLDFQFYDKTNGTPVAIPDCASVVCTWTPSYSAAGGYTIGLTVTDSGGIAVNATDQDVG
jgi:hypothetical protein